MTSFDDRQYGRLNLRSIVLRVMEAQRVVRPPSWLYRESLRKASVRLAARRSAQIRAGLVRFTHVQTVARAYPHIGRSE